MLEYRARLLALALLCVTLLAPSAAQADIPPGWPACPVWGSKMDLYLSPTFAQDHTLFHIGINYEADQSFVIQSTDGGVTWGAPIWTGTHYVPDMVAFSVDYNLDHTAYVVFSNAYPDEKGIYRTIDGGSTWSRIPGPDARASWSLGIASAAVMFIAVNSGKPVPPERQGMFRTTDGGATWVQLLRGGMGDVVVSPDCAHDQTVLVALAGGQYAADILKSTDGGDTWQLSSNGLPLGWFGGTGDIRYAPGYATNRTVFCRSAAGLHQSVDGGEHWRQLAAGLAPDPVLSVGSVGHYQISPRYETDQTVWLAGQQEGQLISTDAGASWRPVPDLAYPYRIADYCWPDGRCRLMYIRVVFTDTTQSHLMWYRSFDAGATWQCLESSIPPEPPPAPAEVPEPAAWLLLGSGLAALAGWARQRC